MTTGQKRAYAAGFFDGEGTIHMNRRKDAVRMAIAQKDTTILELIRGWLGCGKIIPVDHGNCNSLYFSAQADVLRAIEFIYPYVQDPKKKHKLRIAHLITDKKPAVRARWRKRFYASL